MHWKEIKQRPFSGIRTANGRFTVLHLTRNKHRLFDKGEYVNDFPNKRTAKTAASKRAKS